MHARGWTETRKDEAKAWHDIRVIRRESRHGQQRKNKEGDSSGRETSRRSIRLLFQSQPRQPTAWHSVDDAGARIGREYWHKRQAASEGASKRGGRTDSA